MLLQDITFEDFNIQVGWSRSNYLTQLLTLKSTVQMTYQNPSFCAADVAATVELQYYDLKLASGHVSHFRIFSSSTALAESISPILKFGWHLNSFSIAYRPY